MVAEKKNWLSHLTGGEKSNKKPKIYWMILLVLFGMAIMIFSSFLNVSEEISPNNNELNTGSTIETSGDIDSSSISKNIQDYEKAYENQITEALVDMLGVEKVTVIVNLDATEEIIVEKNTKVSEQTTSEVDAQGGKRNIHDYSNDEEVVIYKAGNDEQPLVLKTKKPEVRGAIVIVEGAENLQLKAMIIDAVQRFLDIPSYKIAILPKK